MSKYPLTLVIFVSNKYKAGAIERGEEQQKVKKK